MYIRMYLSTYCMYMYGACIISAYVYVYIHDVYVYIYSVLPNMCSAII